MPKQRPKFRTASPAEKELAARIVYCRRIQELEQAQLAKKLDLSRDQLASIEVARTMLRTGVALKMAAVFRCSLAWLAGDLGPMLFYIALTTEEVEKLHLTKPFLDEYQRVLRPVFRQRIEAVTPQRAIFRPLTKVAQMGIKLELMGATFEDTARSLPHIVASIRDACPPHLRAKFTVEINDAIREFMRAHGRELEAAGGRPDQKESLTSVTLKSKQEAMKSEMQKLMDKVRKKASQPGAKAQLARDLTVAPARISEWLRGDKEPGGEYTLRLLKWVES